MYGGKSVFNGTGGGDMVFDNQFFDAGSEPGKEVYIHVCYARGSVLAQEMNKERTRESSVTLYVV